MPNNPLISIIIPVYGVEKYIKDCIESILMQTFENFECLIIDDGSLDHSIRIAKSCVGNDKRFVFFEKNNGGQGSARNMGLDYARGDYIAFVDSDDYVHPQYLELMFTKITESKSDICTCNVNYIDKDGSFIKIFRNDTEEYNKHEDFLFGFKFLSNFMWDKLWKRSLFENKRFDTSLRTNEDVFLIFELVFNANLCSVDEELYFYLQRPGATSKAIHPTYFSDRIKIKNKQEKFAIEHGFSHREDYLNYCYLKTFLFFCLATFSRYSDDYLSDVKCLMKEVEKDKFSILKIFKVFKIEKKVGLSLFIFKLSPIAFYYLAKFWFRNNAA